MMDTLKGNSRLWLGAFALLAFGSLAGCISDDSDPAEDETGGTGGTSGSGGTSGTSGTGGTSGSAGTSSGGPPGTACAAIVKLPADKPAIADFETDTPPAPELLGMWSLALGDDTSLGVFTGPFGYGDDDVDMTTGQPIPETFALVTGHESEYAVGIADTEADEYGGGMGLWFSVCLDATAFTGISFWVRGNAPTGEAKLSLLMNETTSSTASGKKGTCSGVDTGVAETTTCVHPSAMFPVTDAWSEVRLAWSAITAGRDVNTPIVPDGHNIWQVQFDVGLVWVDGGGGMYVPTPAEYAFEVDDMTFY